jgi:hypothetical protein
MIPVSKINYANNYIIPKGAQAFFVFHFLDSLYMIEYTPETFADFSSKSWSRCDRGGVESSNYCFIPIEKLSLQPDYKVL